MKLSQKITPTALIKSFQKSGLSLLESLSEKTLTKMIIEANNQYYNTNPILTDNEYDILKEFIIQKYPNNQIVKQIGAPIEKNKVTLPYFMGSMEKIKPDTNALPKWKNKYKGPYVLSAKLDGVSGLYSTESGTPKLYTRGNGIIGQDITHLIPYLQFPTANYACTIRGEFIMSKNIFNEKYKNNAANARNLISGIINSKTLDKEKLNNIDFVAYEVINPTLKPSEQMKALEIMNVKTVLNTPQSSTLSNEKLSEKLINWRDNYEYEIDGVIVIDDNIYERKKENPKHAFAFKMVLSEQIAEAKVLDVLWSPSKDGYLKPRIRIEPITIGGATIEFATAFNAAYVKQNKIGIGSIIRIVRSGRCYSSYYGNHCSIYYNKNAGCSLSME